MAAVSSVLRVKPYIDRLCCARHYRLMKTARLLLCFAMTPSLAGCASVATRLPDISLPALEVERESQEESAFAEMERLHKRLWTVAYPVLSENAELCPKTRPDIGAVTYSLKTFPKDMRAAAARELGARETPSIRRIIQGGEAEKAGLRIGDAFLDANGKPIGASSKAMRAMLKDGRAKIAVKRGDKTFDVTLTPKEICDYGVKLSMRSTINAYASGKTLILTSGMMNFTQSDDELALIVAHELAHNTMGHIRKIVGNMILSGFATRYTRPFESEADYVGLYYLARAGYSPDKTQGFWQRMALIGPRSVGRAKTHPTYPDRYLRLEAARAEILAKQAAGQPLEPNFIDADK